MDKSGLGGVAYRSSNCEIKVTQTLGHFETYIFLAPFRLIIPVVA